MATGPLTAYAFWWYSPNSGDYYHGTVYDDGTYGYSVGQTIYSPIPYTESGGSNGFYTIYGISSASTSGYSAGNVTTGSGIYGYYWDGDSDQGLPFLYDTATVTGYSGLGSEYNIVYTASGYECIGYDYFEANYAATLTAYAFRWYSPNSGDYYHGTVYDDGTYGYSVGQTVSGPYSDTESGGADGYYIIYGISSASTSGRGAGEVTAGNSDFGYYYDGDSGRTLSLYYDSATVTGSFGLGSEYNYVYNGNSSEYIGNDYHEASYTLTAYAFWWYSPNSGDYYNGTVYDDGTYGYSVGQTVYGPNSTTESSGADGYYYIYNTSSASASVYGAGEVTTGNSDFSYYYDGDSGQNLSLYYDSATATGWFGLGSEYNYAYYDDGSNNYQYDYFGGDYDEADTSIISGDIYYYIVTDTVSGDVQYGYVYDDGIYRYYDGYSTYTDSETGGYWHYQINSSSSASFDAALIGGNYVYSYYDGETGEVDTPYYYESGYAMGSDGLGSGFDYVDFGTGVYEIFSSYDEADLYGAKTDRVYYYYAYNTGSGDIYWGHVYDDGTYGYSVGDSTYFYASDEDGVGYTFYDIYDSVDLGYDSSATGYNYVSSYYDGETGQYDAPDAYASGNASGYDGLGSELDTVDFGTGNSSTFGYGFYEADLR